MANTFTALNLNDLAAGGSAALEGPLVGPIEQGDFDIISEGGNDTWHVLPDALVDTAPAIKAAVQAASAAGGGIVQLFAGDYLIESPINDATINNVTIRGVGPETVLLVDSTGGLGANAVFMLSGTAVEQGRPLNNTTAGATSITYTTASQAGSIIAGDRITVRGLDVSSETECETVIAAAAGNGGTGVVNLKFPLLRTMTSVVSAGARHATNITISDMTIRHITGTACDAINMDYAYNNKFYNLYIEDFDAATQRGISVIAGFQTMVDKCRFYNGNAYSLNIDDDRSYTVQNCYFDFVGQDASAAIRIDYSSCDIKVLNNTIQNCLGDGVRINATSGVTCRRLLIKGNVMSRITLDGVQAISTRDSEICNNYFDGVLGNYAVEAITENRRLKIDSNEMINCSRGLTHNGTKRGTANNNTIYVTVGANTDGILIQNSARDITVCGNQVSGAVRFGIIFSATTYSTCVGNNVSDNGGRSLYLETSTDCTMSNNAVRNSTGNGLEVTNDSTNNIIMGNACRAQNIVEGTGAGNIFIGNVS